MAKRKERGGHTPVMQQFFGAKAEVPDALLFFRMGDFYELFYEDAVVAARELDIQLTSRGKGPEGEDIAMAGVPHHAAAGYLARLLEKGYRVAICEQLADPSTVKGIVPRGVVRVATPGLAVEPDSLDAQSDNYLVAVSGGDTIGLAALELSRADLRACVLEGEAALLAELVRLDPRELLLDEALDHLRDVVAKVLPRVAIRALGPARSLDPLLAGAEARADAAALSEPARRAAAAVLGYAADARPGAAPIAPRVVPYDPGDRLILDEAAVRNLELVRTLGGERKGSLLWLLDRTATPMGARLLKRRLLAPLRELAAIRRRHDAVQALVTDALLRAAVLEHLARVGDLERLATRVELGVAAPEDLGALRDGLGAAEEVTRLLAEASERSLDETLERLTPKERADEVRGMLETALVDAPPRSSTQGGIFREGMDGRLDDLRRISTSSKDLLLELEAREREQTGIGSLKIKYTRVFGYYIEVTRPNLHLVPDHYRRKQTVAGGERFITEELDTLQVDISQADERSRALEAELFRDLLERVAVEAGRVRGLALALADLDVHAALADVAHRYDYARPELDEGVGLELVESRHAIVERLAESGTFVPNDVRLDADRERLMIITGPNMAGKSTTMRQVALAVVLAQMGSFVPAASARVGLCDRVFTRVGASDDLGRGQSTFMVEMREAATILREATRRSLVILDEIGRGTSTYDGLAIAWAVAEHLHDVIGCRALFATHYHELCEIAELKSGVVRFNVAAREHGDDVVFLHKLVEGGANRSYGVAVARLAGVPEIVLARARALLADLEEGSPLPTGASSSLRGRAQLDLFAAAPPPAPPVESPVERTLREIDVDRMRPVDALLALARLKEMLD